jgi:hypothetical protein
MRYSRIKDISLNSYPFFDEDGNPFPNEQKYYLSGDQIIRRGIYEENIIDYPIANLSNIQYLDNDEIRFNFIIIDADDETQIWTSKSFYNDLVLAQNENNPYFNEKRVAIVRIKLNEFSNYSKDVKFIAGEEIAKVSITQTIDSIEDVLYHITYLCDSTEREIRKSEVEDLTPNGYTGLVGFQIID